MCQGGSRSREFGFVGRQWGRLHPGTTPRGVLVHGRHAVIRCPVDRYVRLGHGDRRLHDARHTAATVLLLLGIPDVVDSIMGWEPGGAARMRARYMHITGPMLRKVARQIGEALWELPEVD